MFFTQETQAQAVDYLNLKDSSLSLDCSDRDSNKIRENIKLLNAIDVENISLNKHWFYYDLGMANYKLFLLFKDSAYLNASIDCMNASLKHQGDFHHAVYNLALFHFWNNEPNLSEKFCNDYLALQTDKDSKKEIRALLKKIREKRK